MKYLFTNSSRFGLEAYWMDLFFAPIGLLEFGRVCCWWRPARSNRKHPPKKHIGPRKQANRKANQLTLVHQHGLMIGKHMCKACITRMTCLQSTQACTRLTFICHALYMHLIYMASHQGDTSAPHKQEGDMFLNLKETIFNWTIIP